MIIKKLKTMCNTYKIDFSEVSPYTIENEQKIIGLWDFDGHYKKFKTLGAKRYMVLTDKELGLFFENAIQFSYIFWKSIGIPILRSSLLSIPVDLTTLAKSAGAIAIAS